MADSSCSNSVSASTRAVEQSAEVGRVCQVVAEAASFSDAANALVDWAKDLTGCESAMLRLLEREGHKEGWIPALVHRGLSPRFLQDEALIGAEECICGRVCLGRVDPDLPFFSQGRSFCWGHVQSIGSDPAAEALGDVRGRCILEGYESVAVVPLLDEDGSPVGSLHLADRAVDRFEPHLAALESACRACGPFLSRFEEHEVELVKALKCALCPPDPGSIPGLELAISFSSATESASVGGDFCDVRTLPGGDVLVMLGDYAGKGVDAAGMAARARYLISDLAEREADLSLLLEEANRLLASTFPRDKFTSLLIFRLENEGRIAAASAGHPLPLRLAPDGISEELSLPHNPPLGAEDEAAFRQDLRGATLSDEQAPLATLAASEGGAFFRLTLGSARASASSRSRRPRAAQGEDPTRRQPRRAGAVPACGRPRGQRQDIPAQR